MIRRLLIANRGEIAVRIGRACRELGIETVAVYSEPDARAPHVLCADRAVPLGAAAARDSYLSIEKLIEAARGSGADAIHPGYGFLSENAAFAEAVTEAGLVFVGPPAAVIAQMGSKIEARRLMQVAGVPVVPGETPADQSDEGLARALDRVGVPAIIKASAGGGGKGMRRVLTRAEGAGAIQAARREAVAAFGDGTLYVERLIARPHHVEVQVFADHHGHVVHLFERECSAQRRHQKVVEESPSPSLTPALRATITKAAVLAAMAASYCNAGTVEFLVDLSGGVHDDAPFYFLEMNTRLQVEHPVTEQVAGVDLVHAQLAVASGQRLPWTQDQLVQRGHAIEARVYAEDPARAFLPQAGRLLLYREPRMPGIRVDSGVMEGGEVSVHYDPMLAKVISWGETRVVAIARLMNALRAYPILGVHTNVPFLLRLLDHPRFRDGTVDTSFLDTDGAGLGTVDAMSPPPFVAAAMAAHVEAVPGADAGERPSAVESVDDLTGLADLMEDTPVVIRVAGGVYQVEHGGVSEIVYVAGGRNDRWAFWNGQVFRAGLEPQFQSARHATRRYVGAAVTSPMPAKIIKLVVDVGATVKRGDPLVILEAMKMELVVSAPHDATVLAIHCREGELVQSSVPLMDLK